MKYHGTYGDEPYAQSLPSLYTPHDARRCNTRMNGGSPHLSTSCLDTAYILCRLDGI